MQWKRHGESINLLESNLLRKTKLALTILPACEGNCSEAKSGK